MPIDDYIVDVSTPTAEQSGIVLARIPEKRISRTSGEIKLTEDMNTSDIADSDIVESESIVFIPEGVEVFTEIDQPANRNEVGELLDRINSVTAIDVHNGTTLDWSPFYSFQAIQLKHIAGDKVLTHADPTRLFDFEIEIQNTTYTGSILGADMETYQKLVDEINSKLPTGTVEYVAMDFTNGKHGISIGSNTTGQEAATNESTGTTTSEIESKVVIKKLFGVDYQLPDDSYLTATTTGNGEQANLYIDMPQYDARSIRTDLSPTDEYTLVFQRFNDMYEELDGNHRTQTVRVSGDSVTRLDLLLDALNAELYESTTVSFQTKAPTYGQIVIMADESKLLDMQLSDVNLFNSMGISFEIYAPISGGKNLYEVLRYTRRNDDYQREWTRLVNRKCIPLDIGVAPTTRNVNNNGLIVTVGGDTDPLNVPQISGIGHENGAVATSQTIIPAGTTSEGFVRTDLGVGLEPLQVP